MKDDLGRPSILWHTVLTRSMKVTKKQKAFAKKTGNPFAGMEFPQALQELVPDFSCFAKNYAEMEKLKKKGMLDPNVAEKYAQLARENANAASNIAEMLHEVFYRKTKQPQAFLDLISDVAETLESLYSVKLKISESRLQDVADLLRPGMKVITEELFNDTFE